VENNALTPGQIYEAWTAIGYKKGTTPALKLLLLGICGGIFIGLGAHGNIWANYLLAGIDKGLAKFIGAAIFPIGLLLVVLAGAELFTGNNLLTIAVLERRITPGQMLKNWFCVYLGNFIGSVILAALLTKTNVYTAEPLVTTVTNIALQKTGYTFWQAVISGILCNILVVLACWMQAGSREMIGKILIIWFPIMFFVFSGFEHSIANMFMLPLAMFLGADLTWSQIFTDNIIPVTIGNLLGGALFLPLIFHYVYTAKGYAKAKISFKLVRKLAHPPLQPAAKRTH